MAGLTDCSGVTSVNVQYTKDFHEIKMKQYIPSASLRGSTDQINLQVVSPVMTYHGGKILTTTVIKSIFWGTSWVNYVGDKITGTDTLYTGFSNSNYANTVVEFTGTNGQVGPATTYQGSVIDGSPATGGSKVFPILVEVCKMVANGNIIIDPNGNGYYPVYSDIKRPPTANFCAWHASGSCNSVPVQIGFFFNLDGDAGCDPVDTSGLHSQGLAALANVAVHELAEVMSDPTMNSWYELTPNGKAENGDKCAWVFPVPLITLNDIDKTQWKLQAEWSNNAYNTGTGLPNRMGQPGCLSGA